MVGDPQPLEQGDSVGDFHILDQIGEGGMGIVYLARDERLGRRVALKVITPRFAHDQDFRERFEAEARSAAAIDNPNAVSIYSAGLSEERLYIAMRFVDGTDLRTLLREGGPLDPEAAVEIVADVASALDAAHAAGLVHRDVKPANVLLEGSPEHRTAYLTDFGLTKGLHGGGTQLTGTGQWIGTVDYVAPEQLTSGLVDARTDVYALGCVLFELISGSPPFSGSEIQKMWHQVNEPVPPLGTEASPHPLDAVIARATAKDPQDRFHSAGDLARAAGAALGGVSPDDLDEQSVATGAAALGLATADPGRTRVMERTPPPPDPVTTPMGTPPSRSPSSERHGMSGRVAAVVGASLVLAAGLIAAALVVAGGKDGSPGRTVVNNIKTVTNEPPASEPTAQSAVSGEGPEPSEIDPSETEPFATFSQSLYSIEVPTGWSQEESDEPISNYLESTWHDPANRNTTLLVDAQTPAPSVDPIVSAEQVRAQTSQSSGFREVSLVPITLGGLPAARWVFEVSGDKRVDYFINECNVGAAVLGSTDPLNFGALSPTFHRAAASFLVYCE
jgi:serine/threonine protein kinase